MEKEDLRVEILNVRGTAKSESINDSKESDITFEKILEMLSEDEEEYVRRSVAENPSIPERILEKLAVDKWSKVREAVARNPSTPERILVKLAVDKCKNVREYVARNPNTHIEALEKLANYCEGMLLKFVLANPPSSKN